jgi:ceramide glucosyltransferase
MFSIMTPWMLVRDALLVLAVAPFAYYLLAIVAAGKFFQGSSQASPDFFPPVSILKPIRGLDRQAYENFASFCRQDYPVFEILFCVTDEQEPSIPVIRQLIADFPEHPIRLLIGCDPLGASDKVNKLCRLVREAREEILIVTDSDVRVEPGFLRAAAAPFADPAAGGVTCLYRGLTDGSFPANLEALGNSADFAPGVLVAWLLGGRKLNFMLGAVMATTKKHLANLGGFEALVDYFCDDYELGNRIAARGHHLELSRFPVDIVYPHESLAEAFSHQLRWNLSIRFSRPWGHFGLLFTHGLVWSLAGMLLAHSWWGVFGFTAGYALLRDEVALSAGARGMRDRLVREKLWMLPLRDALGFVVWLVSFLPQRIHWRDREFYVREKRLISVPSRR